MSTLTAILMWILVSAGVMDYDCYVQQLGDETSEVQPPPPPSDTSSDGQCTTSFDEGRGAPASRISNGF